MHIIHPVKYKYKANNQGPTLHSYSPHGMGVCVVTLHSRGFGARELFHDLLHLQLHQSEALTQALLTIHGHISGWAKGH